MNAANDFDELMRQALGIGMAGPGQSPLRPEFQQPQPAFPGSAPIRAASPGVPYQSPVDQGSAEPEMGSDRRAKWAHAAEGIGAAVDQLGSAFDQRLSSFVAPRQGRLDFRPNVNPGIAQMAQQLLLAAARR